MIVDLSNKYALVCGSSKGIGLAIAQQFAQSGANVILLARNKELLDKAFKSLHKTDNNQHYIINADMQDYRQIGILVDEFIHNVHPIDIVVNNSGGPQSGPLVNAEIEEFQMAFERHLFSSQLILQKVLPNMKKQSWGRIINIISFTVKQPKENLGVSNTLRAAMASWSKTLSKELAQYNITINNILPGMINTERLRELYGPEAKKLKIDWNEYSLRIVNEIPLGRLGKPEELGYLACFLASEFGAYISGTSIPIDGGLTKSI